MPAPLTFLIVLAASMQALWAAWYVVRDRPVLLRQFWGIAVIATLQGVQMVTMTVVFLTDGHAEQWELVGYGIVAFAVLPCAALWAFVERTRWSSVVMCVAALTVLFLEYRLHQIWTR